MRSRKHHPALAALGLLAMAGTAALLYHLIRHDRGARRRTPKAATPRWPITQSIVPTSPADIDLGVPGRNADQRLDEALQETFPASDPIAVSIE